GLFLASCGTAGLAPTLRAAVPACDSDNAGIVLPAGFCAFVAADGLGMARHMAVAPNGDLYVALLDGGVVALRDTNGDGRCQVKDRTAQSPGQDPCPILEKNGGIWKFDENKLGQTQADGTRFATGLRQMPAIAWNGDALYIAMNSRDQLDIMWPGKFTAQEN